MRQLSALLAGPLPSASVSCDLYFLARQPGQSWEDAMSQIEGDLDSVPPLDGAALAIWDPVRAALAPVLPDAEEFVGAINRELTDDTTGIQVSMIAGELSLTVPYWSTGPAAERVVGILREIAAKVEDATGLTAYDPQAEAPFLGDGEYSTASTLDGLRRSVTEAIQRDAVPESAAGSRVQTTGPRRLWERLFGRDPR
jgi:hypothetical protein